MKLIDIMLDRELAFMLMIELGSRRNSANVTDLSKTVIRKNGKKFTYCAVYEVAMDLQGEGLLESTKNGRSRFVSLTKKGRMAYDTIMELKMILEVVK